LFIPIIVIIIIPIFFIFFIPLSAANA
jgi:hypothetical protein